MLSTRLFAAACVAVAAAVTAGLSAVSVVPDVSVVVTPENGIQPQAAVDSKGDLHLVYFTGDSSAGDVYYARLRTTGGAWKTVAVPVRVNSIAGSALATGTVRGAQIALGRNGVVHVAWHGSKPVEGGSPHPPVWYARSVDGSHFEDQRIVSGAISGIDGARS